MSLCNNFLLKLTWTKKVCPLRNIKEKNVENVINTTPKVTKPEPYYLTHFKSMFHFYTPWKRHKTTYFLGDIEIEHCLEMGKCPQKFVLQVLIVE